MVDCGRYDRYITIEKLTVSNEENEIGENARNYVADKQIFARIESRVGSLLAGRQADTVVEKTTHKISYPMLNYPNIAVNTHRITYNNKIYNIDYVLDDDELDEEMQLFCSCEV